MDSNEAESASHIATSNKDCDAEEENADETTMEQTSPSPESTEETLEESTDINADKSTDIKPTESQDFSNSNSDDTTKDPTAQTPEPESIEDNVDTSAPVEDSEPTCMDLTEEKNDDSPTTPLADHAAAAEEEENGQPVEAVQISPAEVNEEPTTTVTEKDKVTSVAKPATRVETVEAVKTVEQTTEAVVNKPAEIEKAVDQSPEKMEVETEREIANRVKAPTTNGASNGASNDFNFETDSDSIEEIDDSAPKKKKAKVYTDWVCVNPQCTLNGKSHSEMVTTARPFVLGHYGVKVDETKKRKVCRDCLDKAEQSRSRMVQMLKNHQLIIEEKLPIPRESTVTLDDSDQEMHTDSSTDSEFEVDLSDLSTSSEDDVRSLSKNAKNAKEFLNNLIDREMQKHDVKSQIDGTIEHLTKSMDNLLPEIKNIDKEFDQMEKMVDEMRENLYRPFRPVPTFLEPLDLDDSESQSDDNIVQLSQPSAESPRGGTVAKRVTQLPQSANRAQQQPEVQAITQTTSTGKGPSLPGHGELRRQPLNLDDKAYAMRGSILNEWKEGVVIEILEKEGEKLYKLRFDTSGPGKATKNFQTKILSPKHLAYFEPAPVRLQVGTRIIGIYKEPEKTSTERYYSGIVAEPPKQMNGHRYLVFFDDGYASYIEHIKIRVVCKQSANGVWEDVHANSRDFIMKYLMQYPERPMVKLTKGQVVRTEWGGSWWFAQVEEIDASLVKVIFHVNDRRESIYRGSTRLGPLYIEMQEQKKRLEAPNKTIARRNTAFNRNKPYVEYTRTADDESNAPVQEPVKRAVARKSTTALKKPDTSIVDPKERWDYKGKVAPVEVTDKVEGIPFVKHQCSAKCKGEGDKYEYNEKKMKGENPLIIPIKLGWKRELLKFNNYGRRHVFYIAPCGRRLRSMEEIHRYLRVTQSLLEIDFFNLEWYVHVLNEFSPDRQFYTIPDISYGKENVIVNCVNSLDNTFPEYVEYSTCRIPQKDVNINLEDEFLTCCDCTDDCQDKDRCACWQLTINQTVASNPEARTQPNVGYVYRRLLETVSTGIFECNRKCKCKQSCLNRVAQHPLRVKLQVFKTEKRGWGIRALCDIPRGGFICIYVGNLYSNNEANQYGQDFGDEYFAELDLIEVVERNKEGYESDIDDEDDIGGDVEALSDELDTNSTTDEETTDVGAANGAADTPDRAFEGKNVIPTTDAADRQTRSRNKDKQKVDKKVNEPVKKPEPEKPKYISTRKLFGKNEDVYIMDAKVIGNIGRYLNHSCSPNVFVQNCFIDTHDLRFPWVAFFAQCHIPAGQELCWDYAYIVDQVQGKEIYCQCGSEMCRGRLL